MPALHNVAQTRIDSPLGKFIFILSHVSPCEDMKHYLEILFLGAPPSRVELLPYGVEDPQLQDTPVSLSVSKTLQSAEVSHQLQGNIHSSWKMSSLDF